jgi:hypothetical protein
VAWHRTEVVLSNNVFHATVIIENVEHETNAFTYSDKVKVAAEEGKVYLRRIVVNTRPKLGFARFGHWSKKIGNHSQRSRLVEMLEDVIGRYQRILAAKTQYRLWLSILGKYSQQTQSQKCG